MQLNGISALTRGEHAGIKDRHQAAQEFEAVLIGQLLEGAFGQSEDSSAQTMMEFGREHLSRVIAKGGGLGLTTLIEQGLDAQSSTKSPGGQS